MRGPTLAFALGLLLGCPVSMPEPAPAAGSPIPLWFDPEQPFAVIAEQLEAQGRGRVWALADDGLRLPLALTFAVDEAPLRQARAWEPACRTARRVFSDAERRDYLLGVRSFVDECAPLTLTLLADEGLIALSIGWPLIGTMARASDPPVTSPMLWTCRGVPGQDIVEGTSLDSQTFREIIQPDWVAMQTCWRDDKTPKRSGVIVEIDAKGNVSAIRPEFESSDAGRSCALELARDWSFPADPGREATCFRLDLAMHLRALHRDQGCTWLAFDDRARTPELDASIEVELDTSLEEQLAALAQRNLCPGTHLHVWGDADWREVSGLLARLRRLGRDPVSFHFRID